MTQILGEREYVLGLTFNAYPSAEELALIMAEAVRVAGMTPYSAPLVKSFPTPEGLGGDGELHYQAIGAPVEIFQMLTESGIMGNTYVWQDKWRHIHKRTRILLASCLAINRREYGRYLAEKLGPVQDKGFFVY